MSLSFKLVFCYSHNYTGLYDVCNAIPSRTIPSAEHSKFISPSMTAVLLTRLTLTTLTILSLLTPHLLQPTLTTLWTALLHSPLYKTSYFETLWTVLSYSIIEPYITHIYITQPHRRILVQDLRTKDPDAPIPRPPRGMKRPSRRLWEGIVYVFPLLAMDLCLIKKFAGVSRVDMLVSGGYAVSSALVDTSNSTVSIGNDTTTTSNIHSTFLIPTLHNFSLASPLQTTRALPPQAPTPGKLLTDLLLSFLIYDTLFFFLHLSLHHLPIRRLRSLHAPHHTHTEMHPQITNALSIPERLSLVLLANFSLNIIGAHVLSRTVFVPCFVWMLVELHSGLELSVGFEKVLPRGWAQGSRMHALHHRVGEGGFEPFFGWWDAALVWWVGRGRGGGKEVSVARAVS